MPEERHGQPLGTGASRQPGPQRPLPRDHQGRVDTAPPQLRQRVQCAPRPLLHRQPRAQEQEHVGAARAPAPQYRTVQGGVPGRQVDAQRRPYDVARADPDELRRRPFRRAHHPAVGVRGPGVDPVGGGARRSARHAPGTEHAVHTLVRHRHRRDAGPSRPFAGPPQGRPVGHLQAVGSQLLQDAPDPVPVGQDPVAAGAGQDRARQGDHPPLAGVLVACGRSGHDQDRVVSGGAVSGAQGLQSGTQPARLRRHEVREPDDAQPGSEVPGLVEDEPGGRTRPRRHAATAVRSASTAS